MAVILTTEDYAVRNLQAINSLSSPLWYTTSLKQQPKDDYVFVMADFKRENQIINLPNDCYKTRLYSSQKHISHVFFFQIAALNTRDLLPRAQTIALQTNPRESRTRGLRRHYF